MSNSEAKSLGENREDARLLPRVSTTTSTAPVTSAGPDMRKRPTIEELERLLEQKGSEGVEILASGEVRVRSPDERYQEGVHFGVYDFADYMAGRFNPPMSGISWKNFADDYFTDVEACGDDLEVGS